ncbi:cilia- and flagella-associated protein [Histomonas meleagridis]|uniref:cilia- and flagella-associated protein 36 n=1 Tax=Histomonas meleagridis TaxID=135588 RepID=UPI00355A6E83|nr:cilia- and flagella-associated protein [Histomonas meleagridis]KAH0803250.1 cilia- and flagella-associated protein 36 [Histomonas meleagridis]
MSSVLEAVEAFFYSPMWVDTIKDFVLANCFIFTGEEEFSLEHLKCHKKFCEIIENTLKIYLLDIIGVSFEDFQKACFESYGKKDSIASIVIGVLKQATDFQYFAAKMYAYNLALDSEAAASFLIRGDDENAFFVTESTAVEEARLADQEAQLATSRLNKFENDLGIPESKISDELTVDSNGGEQTQNQVNPAQEPPKTPKISDEERAVMKKRIQAEREKINKSIDPKEAEKRKEAFQKRKQELAEQKRAKCREQIDLNLKKHEKPVVQPEEDPIEAIKRALAGRIKTIIEED